MRKAATVCAALAALLTATQSGASIASAQRAEFRAYLADYARCMVQQNHRRSADLILSNVDNEAMERRFADIAISKPVAAIPICTQLVIRDGIGVNFNGDPLRFALAEALVKADLKADAATDFSDRPPLTYAPLPSEQTLSAQLAEVASPARRAQIRQAYDRKIAGAWLARFAECVVRHDPSGTRNWIMQPATSPTEGGLLASLQPAMGACLIEGRALTFDKQLLRGQIAVAYYRLAAAKPASSTESAS